MKIIATLIASASLAGMTAVSHADDIHVRGSPTCAEYLAAKQQAKHGDTGPAMGQLRWFLGYMSGLAVGSHVDVLHNNNDGTSVIDWLDLYCGRLPKNYLSDAGDVFYGYLKQQNGQK